MGAHPATQMAQGATLMKVLYLSYDGMTDPLGQSQVIPYLCGLASLGHTIHIISFEKETAYLENRSFISHILTENGIIWHPKVYTKTPPVLSTLKDLYTLQKTCYRLHSQEQFDFLHCRSYITSLVALSLKKRLGIPFIFDMRGFWADERVEGKIWNLSNPVFKIIYKYFKYKELEFLNHSAQIISLTYNAKKEIASWPEYNGKNAEKITVIPCCADLEHFDIQSNAQKSLNRKKLGITDDDLVVTYVGSLGTWYMAEEMLLLFKTILHVFKNAKLLLISTHTQAEVDAILSKVGLDTSKVVLKAGKRVDMPSLISCADLAVFFVRPSFSKKASSPTKMGEIMGCGIPIICNSGVGDVADIVKETQCGVCIDDFSAKTFENVIDQIPELLKHNPDKIRAGALKYYALKDGIRKYNEVYDFMRKCKL